MENIKQVIKAQYSGNEAGLNWTKSFIKDMDESREIRKECLTNQLVLNRVNFANDFNPSVAVFGESQVGSRTLSTTSSPPPKARLPSMMARSKMGMASLKALIP